MPRVSPNSNAANTDTLNHQSRPIQHWDVKLWLKVSKDAKVYIMAESMTSALKFNVLEIVFSQINMNANSADLLSSICWVDTKQILKTVQNSSVFIETHTGSR